MKCSLVDLSTPNVYSRTHQYSSTLWERLLLSAPEFWKQSPATLLAWWRFLLVVAASIALGCSWGGIGDEDSPDSLSDTRSTVSLEMTRQESFNKAVQLLRAEAVSGDVSSQELLAFVLMRGPASPQWVGVPGVQTCDAFQWLHLAADHGSKVGRAYVGLLSQAQLEVIVKTCHPGRN